MINSAARAALRTQKNLPNDLGKVFTISFRCLNGKISERHFQIYILNPPSWCSSRFCHWRCPHELLFIKACCAITVGATYEDNEMVLNYCMYVKVLYSPFFWFLWHSFAVFAVILPFPLQLCTIFPTSNHNIVIRLMNLAYLAAAMRILQPYVRYVSPDGRKLNILHLFHMRLWHYCHVQCLEMTGDLYVWWHCRPHFGLVG